MGSEIEIETIEKKKAALTIPAGIQHDTALKIPGEGVRRRGRPGDLLVRVKLRIPRQVSSEVKELYDKILEVEGFKPGHKKGFFSGLMGKG